MDGGRVFRDPGWGEDPPGPRPAPDWITEV